MVADFMRYYTWIKKSQSCRFHDILYQSQLSHGCRFHEILSRVKISHGCIFHEIFHQYQNISLLQISWDILPESKYLVVADFMRYYATIKISHGCRFHEILRQNQNISWLQISWYIIPESKYLIVAYFTRSFTRIKISYDELREDVMIWVLETRIFESDQNECQSVVPTLYVVKICGNCILNAKNQRNSSNGQFHCFHYVRKRAPCWNDLFLMETRETKTHFSQWFQIVWPKQGIPWESWRPGLSENVVVFKFWRF